MTLKVLTVAQLFIWVLRPKVRGGHWPNPFSQEKWPKISKSTKTYHTHHHPIDDSLLSAHKNFSPIGPKSAELWPKNVCPNMGLCVIFGP